MSNAPKTKRYKLSKVVSEAREKHPPIEFETDDGQVFTIDAPQFWSDAAIDPTNIPLETALEVMGVEQWEKFKKAGGTVASMNLVIAAWAEDQGVDLGKSSASSTS